MTNGIVLPILGGLEILKQTEMIIFIRSKILSFLFLIITIIMIIMITITIMITIKPEL